jgi:hypothetical protein
MTDMTDDALAALGGALKGPVFTPEQQAEFNRLLAGLAAAGQEFARGRSGHNRSPRRERGGQA